MVEGGEQEKVVKVEDGVSESAIVAFKEEVKEEQKEYIVDELLEQYKDLIDSRFAEMLQDKSTPDFVEEVVTLSFDDSVKLLENLIESLKTDPIDYKVVDGHIHQFKGNSFRCLDHLEKVKEEFKIV